MFHWPQQLLQLTLLLELARSKFRLAKTNKFSSFLRRMLNHRHRFFSITSMTTASHKATPRAVTPSDRPTTCSKTNLTCGWAAWSQATEYRRGRTWHAAADEGPEEAQLRVSQTSPQVSWPIPMSSMAPLLHSHIFTTSTTRAKPISSTHSSLSKTTIRS